MGRYQRAHGDALDSLKALERRRRKTGKDRIGAGGGKSITSEVELTK